MANSILDPLLSSRTRRALRFDATRVGARLRSMLKGSQASSGMLHLGCGSRRVPGFLNVDVKGSEHDVDLGSGRLPWRDGTFSVVVSQQVIEHLELGSELRPLLRELVRVVRPGGEVWLSCPDMEAICRSYLADGGKALIEDRKARWPNFTVGELAPSHIVNVLFHQGGQHVNLFDFALLKSVLLGVGFKSVDRVHEQDLLSAFPAFPPRNDDAFSLYVRATR